MSIYDFSATTMDGEEKSLADYKGKTLLIVNTASKCGFTPQYEGLEELYRKYKDRGFVVLAFPSNQFNNQEPGTNDEISEFCEVNFGISFPLFQKVNVKGEHAHPLFTYLTRAAKGMVTNEIKWNFTKFLVDKNGDVVDRFAPQTNPERITKDIEKIL